MSSACVVLFLLQEVVFLRWSAGSLVGFHFFFLVKDFHDSLMDLLISAKFA